MVWLALGKPSPKIFAARADKVPPPFGPQEVELDAQPLHAGPPPVIVVVVRCGDGGDIFGDQRPQVKHLELRGESAEIERGTRGLAVPGLSGSAGARPGPRPKSAGAPRSAAEPG